MRTLARASGRRWLGMLAAAALAATVAAHPAGGQTRTAPVATLNAAALPLEVEEPRAALLVLSPNSRVRGLDEVARKVLQTAVACSPTVARMVVDLQASDLIVSVEAKPLPKKLLGDLRIVVASAGTRYVRIRLRVPSTDLELVSVLGHELQHATEVAAAADVRDAATQRAFYLRVGYERMGGGLFETDAALAVGRVVEQEARGCRRGGRSSTR